MRYLILLALIVSLGCGPKTEGTMHTVGATLIDCMTPQANQLKKEFGPVVDYALLRAVGADGKLDRDAIKAAAVNFGVSTGACVLADAVSRLGTLVRKAMTSAPQSEAAKVDFDDLNASLRELYPGVAFKVNQ